MVEVPLAPESPFSAPWIQQVTEEVFRDFDFCHGLLGNNVKEFSSNPLLFTVFLRSHHGESTVLTADKDALFTRYAAQLTGSAEREKWPWWRKVWEFAKNGNITKKERFLADVVSHMAGRGRTAVLVERLEPKKNKRDRRLKGVIDDPESRILSELKDSALLVEEKIEAEKDRGAFYSRRITFVTELMIVAMERIETKLASAYRLRTELWTQAWWWVLCPAMCYGAVLISRPRMEARAISEGYDPILYRLLLQANWDNAKIVLLLLLTLFSLSGLTSFWELFPKRSIQQYGLLQKKFLDQQEGRQALMTVKIGSAVIAPYLGLMVFAFAIDDWWLPVGFTGIVTVGVELASVLLSVRVRQFVVNSLAQSSAQRVIKKAANTTIRNLTGHALLPLLRRRATAAYSAFALLVWVAAAVLSTHEGRPPVEPTVIGYRSLSQAQMLSQTVSVMDVGSDLAIGLVIWSVAFLLVPLVPWRLRQVELRLALGLVEHSAASVAPRPRRPLLHCVVTFWGFSVLPVALMGVALCLLDVSSSPARLRSLGIPPAAMKTNGKGLVSSLDFTGIESPERFASVASLRSLEMLRVPRTFRGHLQFGNFSGLYDLTAPASTLTTISSLDLKTLTLYDPQEGLNHLANRTLERMRLVGQCGESKGLSQRFPRLNVLSMDDNCFRALANDLITMPRNTTFQVTGVARLDWLQEVQATYVIDAEIDEASRNLSRLTRLILRGCTTPKLLASGTSLHWILINMAQRPPHSWFRDLRVAAAHWPQDVRLEVTFDDGASLRVAAGKSEAEALLGSLSEEVVAENR